MMTRQARLGSNKGGRPCAAGVSNIWAKGEGFIAWDCAM